MYKSLIIVGLLIVLNVAFYYFDGPRRIEEWQEGKQLPSEIKADVVRQDEREGGLRGILNFGHTLGHAIENAAGYGEYLHGEAVAIGMVYAARLSVALKGLSVEESERIEKLLVALKLPVAAPGLLWSDLRAAMAVDKKTVGGLPKFVLADRIGHVDFGCEVPEELMKEVWQGMC